MTYLIHAPGLGHDTLDEMAALGAGLWLGMQAGRTQALRLDECKQVFLAPQLAQRFVLIMRKTTRGYTPALWLSYAHFNAHNEALYVANPAQAIAEQASQSGDRLWFLHLMAQGEISQPVKNLLRQLFTNQTARSLSPRSHISGQRVVLWRGKEVGLATARAFWSARPILAHSPSWIHHE